MSIRENLQDLMVGKEVSDLTLKAWSVKGKTDILGFIKTKTSVLWKTLLRGWKDKLQSGGKYLQTMYLAKDTQHSQLKKLTEQLEQGKKT